jgi:hypothetical protein
VVLVVVAVTAVVFAAYMVYTNVIEPQREQQSQPAEQGQGEAAATPEQTVSTSHHMSASFQDYEGTLYTCVPLSGTNATAIELPVAADSFCIVDDKIYYTPRSTSSTRQEGYIATVQGTGISVCDLDGSNARQLADDSCYEVTSDGLDFRPRTFCVSDDHLWFTASDSCRGTSTASVINSSASSVCSIDLGTGERTTLFEGTGLLAGDSDHLVTRTGTYGSWHYQVVGITGGKVGEQTDITSSLDTSTDLILRLYKGDLIVIPNREGNNVDNVASFDITRYSIGQGLTKVSTATVLSQGQNSVINGAAFTNEDAGLVLIQQVGDNNESIVYTIVSLDDMTATGYSSSVLGEPHSYEVVWPLADGSGALALNWAGTTGIAKSYGTHLVSTTNPDASGKVDVTDLGMVVQGTGWYNSTVSLPQ